jgi:uncharacterized membrane protein YeaQ/YmgE (transglycosylase-associated protein family)
MAYIVWLLIGVIVAMLMGAAMRRYSLRSNNNSATLAGAFGALIGGVIGDGVPNAFVGEITLLSVVGAVLGALLFCWAIRGRAEDTGS